LNIRTVPSDCFTRWDEKAGLRTGCGVRSQVIDVLKAQIKRRPAMKKVSTVAAKPGKKISQQKLTVGLDLGGRNGKKRAIVATARKLAVLLHHLWVSGEVYEPLHNSQRTTVAAAA
jgi:hypothetical protein